MIYHVLLYFIIAELENYIKYARSLKFAEDPDYDYLIDLFKGKFKNIENPDNTSFDWIKVIPNFIK